MRRGSTNPPVKLKSGDIIGRNIILGTRRTSFRIDPLTRAALNHIARREGITLHELCTAIHSEKPPAFNFTIAVRVAVLRYYMDAATENGHRKAGHGKKMP